MIELLQIAASAVGSALLGIALMFGLPALYVVAKLRRQP